MKAAVRELLRDRRSQDSTRPRRRSSPACPSRPRTTTWSATPSRSARPTSPRTRTAPRPRLVVPTDATIVQRRNQILDLLAAGRTPMSGDAVHARRSSRPPRTSRSCSPARRRRAGSRRISCGRSVTSWPTKLCGAGRRRATRSTAAGCGSPRPSTSASRRSPRSGSAPRPSSRTGRTMTAAAKALGFKKLEPWMANLKNKDLHNGALVAVDYQTGELVAYVGSADYYATSTKQELPAAVRRRRQGLPPAGLGVQAVQLRGRHRRQDASPPARC